MYKYLLIAVFTYAANILVAQTAYVAAPSGLKLRKKADAKGEVIKTLIYGAKLAYIADAEPKVAHKSKEAEGFYLNGFWQKVVAGKDTGYVFDAFLVPFEPFTYDDYEGIYNDQVDNCKPTMCYLLERVFGKGGKIYAGKKFAGEDTIFIVDKKSPYCVHEFSQNFSNGNVVFEHGEIIEIGYSHRLVFKNSSIGFVYLLALVYGNNGQKMKTLYHDHTLEVRPAEDEPGCYSEITIKGSTVVWSVYCGC